MADVAGAVAVAESPVTERWRHLAILVALSCLLLFLGLGHLGLTDRDEGSNAEAAREMVETGDWISPTLNYEPRFAKPAFVYWLMSAAYQALGPTALSARLHSALFTIALILLQYLFLVRVREPVLALMGSLMLLLNVEIVAIGRMAIMDAVLIFFTTLSLFSFWLGLHGKGGQRHAIWGFYVGMALATLAKGPIGLVIPLLAVVPYLTLMRRWGQFWRRGFPLTGTALLLVIAVPWYAAMFAIHGSAYTSSASANTLGRFMNVIGGHGGTIFFYIPILAFGFFPWSGFLLGAILQAWKAWRGYRHKAIGTREDSDTHSLSPMAHRLPAPQELEIFAAGWLVVGFIFFSLSATRLPHYIGPLYPAAAILAASYLHRAVADPNQPWLRASFHLTTILGYILGIILASGPALYATFLDDITKGFPFAAKVTPGLSPVFAAAVVLIGSGLISYFGRSEKRRHLVFWAAGTTIGLVMLIGIQLALPRFHTYFIAPPQELAYIAGENLGADDRLIVYGRRQPSLLFYAKRKAVFITPGQEQRMTAHLQQSGRTMILLPERLKPDLPEEARDYSPLLRRYGYLLLANKPMIELPPGPPPSQTPPPSFHGR